MCRIAAVLIALFAAHAHGAPVIDCRALAEAFRNSPELLSATTLAQTRTCIDDKTWTAAPAASAPKALTRSEPLRLGNAFKLDQGPVCRELSERFAKQGGGALNEPERGALRKCVDDAITTISSQPRPANQANMPNGKKPSALPA